MLSSLNMLGIICGSIVALNTQMQACLLYAGDPRRPAIAIKPFTSCTLLYRVNKAVDICSDTPAGRSLLNLSVLGVAG